CSGLAVPPGDVATVAPGSLLLKLTVPLKSRTTWWYWSLICTVIGVGELATTCLGARNSTAAGIGPGCTLVPALPLIVGLAWSVAVIVCAPCADSVILKSWTPWSAAVKV